MIPVSSIRRSAKFLLPGLALLLAASCDFDVFNIMADPFEGTTYAEEHDAPIATALSREETFSEYAKLLEYCDMFNALNQSTTGVSFTAFAPTNEAMEEFYSRRGISSLEEMSPEYARDFVLYHTVKDSIQKEKFIVTSYVTNLSGDNLTILIDSVNAGQAWLNSEGHITEMALSAYNGKIYVLDRALTPLVETIYDRLAADPASRIMKAAVDATPWKDDLSVSLDTLYDENNLPQISRRFYTFLTVNDESFGRSGIASLDDLKRQLTANDQRGLGIDSLLNEYVGYHILGNSYTMDDLRKMSGSELTRIWGTKARNQVMTVSLDTLASSPWTAYTLNASADKAYFVEGACDVAARNGFLHRIDAYLPVWEPAQARVVWDLADYAEVKNLVPSEEYQPIEPTATERLTSLSSATCYEFEPSAEAPSNKNYTSIAYVTCKSSVKYYVYDESTNKYTAEANRGAENNDRVVFNLGYMGYVQMKTPTIVKGRYKVELSVVYLTDHGFMRQITDGNGGLLRISLDGDHEIYNAPYTQIKQALPGVYTSTLYEEIEFDTTSDHLFKMVIMDPAASTNSKFSLQFDCLTFTPIE